MSAGLHDLVFRELAGVDRFPYVLAARNQLEHEGGNRTVHPLQDP